MSEPTVGQILAAAAGAAGAAGFVSAFPKSDRVVSRRHSMRRVSYLWIAIPGLVALLLPAPRLASMPSAVILGATARRLSVSRSRARRRSDLDREVPQLLDLVAAASAAGLSAVAGVRRSVSVLRGPLGEELRASLDAVDLGARWREELSSVAERLDLPDLRRAVAILGRTETLGSSLTDATRDLAADVRHARRTAVAERARAAPVKMLFPLVFLILPAFLLLTVVPVLLTTVRSVR